MIYTPKAGLTRLAFVALLVIALLTFGALSLVQVGLAAPEMSRSVIGSDVVFSIDPQTVTVTGTQTITPTGSMYNLAPSAVLTLTLSTLDAKAGDLLFFTSTVATNTVFVDTGATAGGSTRTLALDDVIGFIYSNGKWVEAFYSDNS